MRERQRRKEWLAYGVVCLVWGSTYLAIKVGLSSFSPFWFAALRYWIAAPVAAIWAHGAGVRCHRPWRELFPALGVGVLFIGLCNGMVFWSETYLDSSYTALLITASPLWTALLATVAAPLLKSEEKLKTGQLLGLGLGLGGSYMLLRPAAVVPENLKAALVVEVSVVIWALGSLWVRHLRETYHPLEMSAWQMFSGASVLTLIALLRGDPVLVAPVTLASLVALAYLVAFGSLAAFGAYFYLLRVWPATRVATSAYINPVVAVTLGWALLGEKPSALVLAGGAVVILGVFLTLSPRPNPESGDLA